MSKVSDGLGNQPPIGAGITYCAAIEPLVERRPELFQVIEVEPQTTWIKTRHREQPYRLNEEVLTHLLTLPGRKIVHSVGTPVGGSVRPEPAQLELLRRTIEFLDSPWASDL